MAQIIKRQADQPVEEFSVDELIPGDEDIGDIEKEGSSKYKCPAPERGGRPIENPPGSRGHHRDHQDVNHHGDQHGFQVRPEPQKNKQAQYPEQHSSRNEPVEDGNKIAKGNHIKDVADQKGNQSCPKYFVPWQSQTDISRQAKNQANEDKFPVGRDRSGLKDGNENKQAGEDRLGDQPGLFLLPFLINEENQEEDYRQKNNEKMEHVVSL